MYQQTDKVTGYEREKDTSQHQQYDMTECMESYSKVIYISKKEITKIKIYTSQLKKGTGTGRG